MRGDLKPFVDAGSSMISRFLRDERGTATIEILLWMPLLFFILLLAVDASLVFWRHGEMWNVARDLSRTVASGVQSTAPAEITKFLRARYATASQFGPTDFSASVTDNGTEFVVTVQHTGSGLSPIGIIEGLMGAPAAATVRMRKER